MQSPKLTAGTGVLQVSTTDAEDDVDLDAVDKILSQHSNHRSQAGHALQADSPAVGSLNHLLSNPATINRHTGSDMDAHALAPAGAHEAAASQAMGLEVPWEPHRPANSPITFKPHPYATRITAEALPETLANASKTENE